MKKRVTIIVCDRCPDEAKYWGRLTEPYRVALPGERLKTLDLCDEHAKPVRALTGEKKLKGAAPIRRQPLPTILTDLDATA